MIDLHTHSTFSDGSLTPEELVAAAEQSGLTALALTDHDTVGGLTRLLAAGAGRPVRCIAGVEISAEFQPGTLHLLGYFIDPTEKGLTSTLARLRAGRALRNQEILGKLHTLGLMVTEEEVRAHAGEEVIGRPHFALALIARGYVRDKEEAFGRYLARGQPAYAERFRLTPAASIQCIRAAGGVPVLAHLGTLALGQKDLRKVVMQLRDQGLEGLEIYYPEHHPTQVRQYRNLAKDLNLAVTGGSDFHGTLSPHIKLGRGFGSLQVPDDLLAKLEARKPQPGTTTIKPN